MNTIKDLIDKYCPDGVEYKKLGEIADIGTGSQDRKDAVENGMYPFYVRSKDVLRIDKYLFDEEAIIIPGEGGIGDIFHYVKGKYGLHQRAYRVHLSDTSILTKYLYYYFSSSFKKFIFNKAVSATVTSIRKPMLEKFEVPVPPIPVQREIVRILDSFTSLEAELEAELKARRKQYEYYRDQLLSFKHLSGGGKNEVEWKTLGEVGEVCMCKRIMKNQTNAEGCIPFYKIGTFGKKADAFISEELYEEYKQKYSFPRKGEVLISAAGTIGRAVIYDGEPAYFQDSNIVWIANDESLVLNKYLYYFYSVADWRLEGGTIKRLYNNNLKAVRIPLPPLSTQRRIVSILDRFESLVNDITTGLPAEIAARHQQYEYYRDQLLSFKRKS